jgi:hypothetical protein
MDSLFSYDEGIPIASCGQDLIEGGVFEKKQKFQVGLSNIDAVNLMSRLMFCQW